MNRTSKKLKGYTGENPFHESQARAYTDEKIVDQFFPVSLYWSLFNEQHEILLGTRGSGKTILLKMLCYSFLRKFENIKAADYLKSKRFVGFYVPLHLEFIASLTGKEVPDTEKLEYFQFAFNCSVIKSFLGQVTCLLKDCYANTRDQLAAEGRIIKHLLEMWFGDDIGDITCISDIQWHIEVAYQNQRFWRDGEEYRTILPFDREVFAPLIAVLSKVSEDLGLDPDNTSWMACLDEADFLKEPFWVCLNSFMRSEKRPLVLKIATLPFKYTTRETFVKGISVEPNGNDFNFRVLDLQPDSDDFINLTNHLLANRLEKCNLGLDDVTLESFLGVENNDALIDYFRLEMSKGKSGKIPSDEEILEAIVTSLSDKRQKRFERIKEDPKRVESDYRKRFSTVYYIRKMKELDAQGNRTVGWFAGANTMRRLADGNPRRFIQLMHDCVELAREKELTPMNQHRVITGFASRQNSYPEGLPEFGPLLQGILSTVGTLLTDRVHGDPMIDSGCSFTIEEDLLKQELFMRAVQLGIQYSFIFCEDTNKLFDGINGNSLLRLAYLCAVHFWLPMRKGDPVILRTKKTEELFSMPLTLKPTASKDETVQILKQMQLQLSGAVNED